MGNENKTLYMVLKLMENVSFTHPVTGKEMKEKVQGIAGYIPVFENEKDAEESSDNGRFQIIISKT